MRSLPVLVAAFIVLLLAATRPDARRRDTPPPVPVHEYHGPSDFDAPGAPLAARAVTAADTTWLLVEDFETGTLCDPSGWIEVDRTAQLADYFHVDDYAGLPFGPIRGAKSLWCGMRLSTGVPYCSYATLPGYGNGWDQGFCAKRCLTYSGTVAVDYLARWDTEPGYDAVELWYSPECEAPWEYSYWAGGIAQFDGTGSALRHDTFAAPADSVTIRFRFFSDGVWSDEDGMWPTDGAIHIDSLSVSDATGLRVPVEDFEDEAIGATSATHWESCTTPGYGSYTFLFKGGTAVQEDPCTRNLSCLWGFFENSTYNYACGGFPAQKVVPFGNARGQYIDNEIWSPWIPMSGSGSRIVLRFAVYRDLPLDNLMFYRWSVRTIVNGCPGPWRDRNFVYYGGQKDWFTDFQSVGDLPGIADGTHVQLSLGAVDMAGVWCGAYGGCGCHSHAPLIDTVQLFRVNHTVPQWSVRDIDTFQDGFARDGTLTGIVRADMANDVLASANPRILPGDSAVAMVSDPVHGLAADPADPTKKAVYCYVSVWPQGQANKTGDHLSGGPRWPHVATEVVGGVSWTKLRFDQAFTPGGSPAPNMYCIDLNDALFTPGDTICFFYAAKSNDGAGSMTYYSVDAGSVTFGDIAEVAAKASEFTCLPAGGHNRGGDRLYVDGMDGRGAQPYWDTAFQALGILDRVDRFDVRGPTSGVNNRLAGRVADVASQILGVYTQIYWDCGDLSVTLGDGSGTPEKTDDYGLVNDFLAGLVNFGGVYICGDDAGEQLNWYASASATTFRSTFLSFAMVTGNHRPTYGISPAGVRHPTGLFGDDILLYGGCPLLNDFDVMRPTGTALAEMTYGPANGNNAAVVSQRTNNGATTVGVAFSGFAFEYIRDDDNDGVMDRARHLHDIQRWLGDLVYYPTGAVPEMENALAHNHPNPFNPQTAIAFSLEQRGPARLVIFNVAGERVRVLVDGDRAAGTHTVTWDGRNDAGEAVASGVYFYRLVAGDFAQTRKMVLLK